MKVADFISVLSALTALVSSIAALVRSWRLGSKVKGVRDDVDDVREKHAALEQALEETGTYKRPDTGSFKRPPAGE